MKKFLCCLLALVLGASCLCSCQPTLRKAIEEQMRVTERTEFDLSACFNEEDGYHYPGNPWGMTADDFQKNNYYPIQKAVAYGTNGEEIYSVNLRTMLIGRANDEAQIAVTKDEYLYMVSYMFSKEGAKEEHITQKELYAQYLEKLTETFGEPDDVAEEMRTEESVTTTYVTNYWNYTTADGKDTQLQFSEAYTLKTADPIYISFGFVWVNGDVVDETE